MRTRSSLPNETFPRFSLEIDYSKGLPRALAFSQTSLPPITETSRRIRLFSLGEYSFSNPPMRTCSFGPRNAALSAAYSPPSFFVPTPSARGSFCAFPRCFCSLLPLCSSLVSLQLPISNDSLARSCYPTSLSNPDFFFSPLSPRCLANECGLRESPLFLYLFFSHHPFLVPRPLHSIYLH